MSTKGQGHPIILVQVTHSIFLNLLSSITARPIETKFHVEPPLDRRTEGCSNGPGHMTKLATMSIYGKNL